MAIATNVGRSVDQGRSVGCSAEGLAISAHRYNRIFEWLQFEEWLADLHLEEPDPRKGGTLH
jgi:hypothetical protein